MNCEHLNQIDGLQFMPIKSTKAPIFKEWQHTAKKYDLSNVDAVGLVCGKLSGNVEVIDFDLKYDLTGTLMKRYKEMVNEYNPKILDKLVWQKTQSDGYHAIYRCENIEGNQKLAQREATEDEMVGGDKVKVLIETRGEGGQIAIAPTIKYSLVKGTLESIPTITTEERETLLLCAANFNEYFQPQVNYVVKKMTVEGKSPLDDYDQRGDCVSLLERKGWKVVGEKGGKVLLRRPGDTNAAHSGNFDRDRNWFSVFSTSTQFKAQSPYKPSAVYAMLECGGDYNEAAKRLSAEGYGEKETVQERKQKERKPVVIIELGDTGFDYVATPAEMDGDLYKWRTGTFEKGLTWGIPELDEHHLLKRGQFNIMNGRDNVGKSTLMWYLSMISACLHDWRWIVFSSENKFSTVKKRLIEFHWGEDIEAMNEAKYRKAYKFVDDHYKIIKCNKVYTYMDILNMASNITAQGKIDGLLLDPYNSLIRRNSSGGQVNVHDYDYEAASIMQTFTKSEDITFYINCHAISSALRNKDENGFPAAPMKDDTEGGSKWGAKADDFLTGHRLVNHKDEYNLMQIHVRKVKETETGGKCTPFTEPVVLGMYGHYGFRSLRDKIDPILSWHSKEKQVEMELPPKTETALKENRTFTDSRAVKEAKEPVESPYENDPMNPK